MGEDVTLTAATTYYISISELTGVVRLGGGGGGNADYDNWGGAIDCGVDDGLTDDGDVGAFTPSLHGDYVDQDNP
jgi:hypothetical protein